MNCQLNYLCWLGIVPFVLGVQMKFQFLNIRNGGWSMDKIQGAVVNAKGKDFRKTEYVEDDVAFDEDRSDEGFRFYYSESEGAVDRSSETSTKTATSIYDRESLFQSSDAKDCDKDLRDSEVEEQKFGDYQTNFRMKRHSQECGEFTSPWTLFIGSAANRAGENIKSEK